MQICKFHHDLPRFGKGHSYALPYQVSNQSDLWFQRRRFFDQKWEKITKKFMKNSKSKILTQDVHNHFRSAQSTYMLIFHVICSVVIEIFNFDCFYIFSLNLHIFGNDNFIWTKSHLQPIIHVHTKYQDEMCSGFGVFDVDGQTYRHTDIPL